MVQAQEDVAAAAERYVAALYDYNRAKVALALALGVAEGSASRFLVGESPMSTTRRTAPRYPGRRARRTDRRPLHRRLLAGLRHPPWSRGERSCAPRVPRRSPWILLLLGGGCSGATSAVRVSTDDAFVDGDIVTVSARIHGTVQAVHVQENDPVKAGEVLVELDPDDLRLAVQRAAADLQAARAAADAARAQVPVTSTAASSAVSSARAGVEQAQAALDAAEQAVAAARSHLEQAEAHRDQVQQDLERLRQLVEKEEVPRQDYEHARTAAKAAEAAVAEARQQVEQASSRRQEATGALARARSAVAEAGGGTHRLAKSEAELAEAEARVAQAEAGLAMARSDLDRAVIRSPVAGRVGRKRAAVGESVQAGQPLLALVPEGDVWVTANFKETEIAGVRPGQRAIVHVDALGRDYTGRVDSLSPATGSKFSLLPAENATGNYVKVVQRVPVRIVLDAGQDPDHLLRPGMSVVPTVITGG